MSAERNVTRFEVIDKNGRAYVEYDVKISLSYQDGGRTLKVFVTPRADIGRTLGSGSPDT